MTNGEKFEAVFGFKLGDDLCVAPSHYKCEDRDVCNGCQWVNWQNEEYKEQSNE